MIARQWSFTTVGSGPLGTSPIPMDKYRVIFEDIQVRNTKEGALSGDGEYDLSVYILGKLVSLTDLSRSAGGAGLSDVSKYETVKFPKKEIIVEIPKNIRFSIFTVGSEVDDCGRTAFPPNIQNKILSVFKPWTKHNDVLGVLSDTRALKEIQDEFDKNINSGCSFLKNNNEDLGDIVKVYDPGDKIFYGLRVLNSEDFMLRFKFDLTG
jgi:hypothetical protein